MSTLYKYVAPERVDVLANLGIRFTPIDLMNDPFECRFLRLPRTEEVHEAENDDYLAEELETEVFLQNRWYALGLLSLTRNMHSLLMWAHYARNHTGMAIGFDGEHEFFRRKTYFRDPVFHVRTDLDGPGFSAPRDVAYSSRRALDPDAAFFTKSTEWAYEEEVRVFRHLDQSSLGEGAARDAVHLFSFPEEAVREIVVGARANPTMLEAIARLRTTRFKHVDFRRARLHSRKFQLAFDPLEADSR